MSNSTFSDRTRLLLREEEKPPPTPLHLLSLIFLQPRAACGPRCPAPPPHPHLWWTPSGHAAATASTTQTGNAASFIRRLLQLPQLTREEKHACNMHDVLGHKRSGVQQVQRSAVSCRLRCLMIFVARCNSSVCCRRFLLLLWFLTSSNKTSPAPSGGS